MATRRQQQQQSARYSEGEREVVQGQQQNRIIGKVAETEAKPGLATARTGHIYGNIGAIKKWVREERGIPSLLSLPDVEH